MPKKRFVSLILSLIVFLSGSDYAASANTAATPEKSFSEDFESYQILDNDNDTSYYTNNAASTSDIIKFGTPQDGDYTDYPYGTASVYEGNAANNSSMYVQDTKGNKVYGGLDGWYGYYNGGGQQYNRWNRRLSVVKKTGNTNKTQFLNIQPVDSSYTSNAQALFSRNNVSLLGYSYLTGRMAFNSADDIRFNKAGIRITVNPDEESYETHFDAVYFTDSETEGYLDVYFGDSIVCQVAKSTAGKWYTVEYRIYNDTEFAAHKLKIIDEENNTCLADTAWQEINIDYSTLTFEDGYGIMYYANSASDAKPQMMLDDIRFENGGYKEDFESYNLTKYYNVTDRYISNGAKGNKNLNIYKNNGVFEGNVALNNYVYKTLDASSAKGRVYGNIPSWQGYVSEVITGTNTYAVDKWKDTCTVVLADDRYEVAGAGFNKALLLYPRTTQDITNAQHVYAGMENIDFGDVTTIKYSINMYNANTAMGEVKFQLTNGRTTARIYSDSASEDELKYDGNSFKAIFDALKFNNGSIYLAGEKTGTYNVKTTYDIAYTVNTTAKTHSVKITKRADGSLICEKTASLPADMGAFSFDGVTGFRYVASTFDGTADVRSENKVIIDDISTNTSIPSDVSRIPNEMTLTLDTDTEIKDVLRQNYGINFEWGGDHSKYLIENTFEANPNFIERFEDNIPIARMAGVSANWMLWKEAIGDITERGNLYFWHYDARPQYLGPVEWINMVKQSDSGAKFIYTVNLPRPEKGNRYNRLTAELKADIEKKLGQIDTLENMKDLVRFMTLNPDDPKAVGSDGINWAQKRVDLGIKDPVDIYAWELGCEMDTNAQGWYNKDEYIAMCKDAIKAIREVDPDAKISAHEFTSIFYDEYTVRQWHNTVFNSIGKDIDYLSVHYYYKPGEWEKFNDYFTKLTEDINASPDVKDRIKVMFTEHSSGRLSSDASNLNYDYNLPHTMRGTLSTAEFLTKSMNIPIIEANMYHSIQSSSWALMYVDEDGKYAYTGPGYVLELFGKKGVGKSVLCSLTWNDNNVTVPKVTASAIKTENGLNVFLVNSSGEFDTTVNLDLDANYTLSKKTVITADSLTSDNYMISGYKGDGKITYNSNNVNKITDAYKLGAKSIVVLEFKDNCRILNADKKSGNVSYETNFVNQKKYNAICAAYKGDSLLNIKSVFISSDGNTTGTLNMGDTLLKADKLKLFVWNLDKLYPLCEADEYTLE